MTASHSPARRCLAALGTSALLVTGLAACGDDDVAAQVAALQPVTGPTAGVPDAVPPAPPVSTSPAAPSGTVLDAAAELEVEDQRGDGTGARVEFARLSGGSGHVAVLTRDGRVLGSSPVTAGSQPVTIALEPRVTRSGELVAVLYADDGDGAFDPARDALVVDEDGEREAEDFDYVLS